MASVIPEQKKRTIADMKPYFNAVMVAWIDSLHLDEHKPLEWEMSRGIVHDPDKEVESEWACWKPGTDLTITIKDDETTYMQTFLQTEDGWKVKHNGQIDPSTYIRIDGKYVRLEEVRGHDMLFLPSEALSLLDWLQQNREELERLARELA